MSATTRRRRSASTTRPAPSRSARRPLGTPCPWTGSPRSASWIPTSTNEEVRRMSSMRIRIGVGLAVVVTAAVALLLVIGLASAGDDHSLTAVAAQATARFHNLDAAKAAGWNVLVADRAGITCIADPLGSGTMGVHWANGSLLGDHGAIDPTTPEALVYAPNADGQPKLAALEYILFASEWPGGLDNP